MRWPLVFRSTMERQLKDADESLSRACEALAELRRERDDLTDRVEAAEQRIRELEAKS